MHYIRTFSFRHAVVLQQFNVTSAHVQASNYQRGKVCYPHPVSHKWFIKLSYLTYAFLCYYPKIINKYFALLQNIPKPYSFSLRCLFINYDYIIRESVINLWNFQWALHFSIAKNTLIKADLKTTRLVKVSTPEIVGEESKAFV